MKKTISLFFLLMISFAIPTHAQEISLRKGVITDSLSVQDDETYSLFLPSKYDAGRSWPLIVVFDMQGRGKRAISMFQNAAEKYGYVLVGSNSMRDTVSTTQNILVTSRLMKSVSEIVQLETQRVYTAGFSAGARFASLVPSFISDFKGVISFGAPIPNYELLTSKKAFHFIGIVGNEDFNYRDMLDARSTLRRLKFPNQLWIFDGGHQWPDPAYIEKALITMTLYAMSKGSVAKDETFISENYNNELAILASLMEKQKYLSAYRYIDEIIGVYQLSISVDSLIERKRQLRKNKAYRNERRSENAALFKEFLIRDEYQFNLLEDITTLNYNNLGWWNYQVEELKKYEQKSTEAERKMGRRLLTYLNALIEDNIDIETAANPMNEEALSFLWMLKTITEPDNYDYYLKIISDSAKYEDFGTSLFYLEELLKQGYKDKASLYSLEHTALLRITPEFNELIEKYLQDARYEIIEE